MTIQLVEIMKLSLVMLSHSLSFYSWGQTIGFVGANVCLSINPFAEVLITNNVQLEPIEGASSLYRGVTTLNLLSNTDVELMVITKEIIGGHHSFTPEVTVGESKGIYPCHMKIQCMKLNYSLM